MVAERVDERIDPGWETDPTRDYRVILWLTASHADAYDLRGAEDVQEGIAWAEAEARTQRCSYTLYAKVRTDRSGLVWLAGVDPTVHFPPNFDRVHPLG